MRKNWVMEHVKQNTRHRTDITPPPGRRVHAPHNRYPQSGTSSRDPWQIRQLRESWWRGLYGRSPITPPPKKKYLGIISTAKALREPDSGTGRGNWNPLWAKLVDFNPVWAKFVDWNPLWAKLRDWSPTWA